MNCGEAIEVLKKFPKDKPLMIRDGTALLKQIYLKRLTK